MEINVLIEDKFKRRLTKRRLIALARLVLLPAQKLETTLR